MSLFMSADKNHFLTKYQPWWMSSLQLMASVVTLSPSKVMCYCIGISLHQCPNTNTTDEWQSPAAPPPVPTRYPQQHWRPMVHPGLQLFWSYLHPGTQLLRSPSDSALSLWRGEPTRLLEVCTGPRKMPFPDPPPDLFSQRKLEAVWA